MRQITTDGAPNIPAPFSQAIESNGFIYVAGQVPIHPEGEEREGIENRRANERIVSEDIKDQTRQVLEYIGAILEAGDASLDDVVKTTVFLTEMDEYDRVNEVYVDYMSEPYPARSLVSVDELAHDCRIEIEAVAEV